MKDFRQLFIEELKDIYSAEKQIDAIVPELVQMARHPKLKQALEAHHLETKKHIERIEKIGKELGVDFSGAHCEAMNGLVKECRKVLELNFLDQVLDAALIGMMQRIEHYEIAVYGVLRAFAKHMKLKEAETLFQESCREESFADKKLSELAEGTLFGGGLNSEASKRKSA